MRVFLSVYQYCVSRTRIRIPSNREFFGQDDSESDLFERFFLIFWHVDGKIRNRANKQESRSGRPKHLRIRKIKYLLLYRIFSGSEKLTVASVPPLAHFVSINTNLGC
jgi:hypothetical protein